MTSALRARDTQKTGASNGLSSGGVTVALDRIEKVGFIRREPDPVYRSGLPIKIVPTKLRKLAGT